MNQSRNRESAPAQARGRATCTTAVGYIKCCAFWLPETKEREGMKRAFTMREIKDHDRQEEMLFHESNCDGAGAVRSKLLISRQLWRDNGQWDRYYQAREGRVHGTRYCPTLSETTTLTALWEMSAEPIDVVMSAGYLLCGRCFPEAPRGGRKRAVACPGSGERSRCRCGDPQCRQMCPHCAKSVLVTPSGVLRRHGS